LVTQQERDEVFIQRTFELALQGRGMVSPNPMVGALVVKDGEVLGQGFHEKAGLEHAEIIALRQAGKRARGATLYINLEPCCHHGKTPPCTEQIIEAGIKKVVAAVIDPNPLVKGKGMAALEKAGIQTRAGVLETKARRLNEVFFKYISTGLPFVILKAGLTLDGKIAAATGQSRWITGEASRQKVHEIRSWVDAVLIGAGTVKKDDPLLTARGLLKGGKQPLRVVIDYKVEIPLSSQVVVDKTARTLVVLSSYAPSEKVEPLEKTGVETLIVADEEGSFSLKKLFEILGERKITSVMIEGGAKINGLALSEGVVDKILFFYAPKILGASALSVVGGEKSLTLEETYNITGLTLKNLGEDFLLEGYLENSPCSPASFPVKDK
jgi:diaminohydroxyphosphoribosylaminopyrimidine deaminase/5-amino-6-(5-phosphoribosylamino)uracil reductase